MSKESDYREVILSRIQELDTKLSDLYGKIDAGALRAIVGDRIETIEGVLAEAREVEGARRVLLHELVSPSWG